MKISTKLATLVAIPLVSLVLLGLISAQTLQQVRIGGDAYGRIVDRKDLIADVLPPPLYLVEASLDAHRLVSVTANGDATKEAISSQTDALNKLETDYNDHLAAWKKKLDTNDPVTKQLFDQVDVSGQDFWRIYHEQFLPAFEAAAAISQSMGGTVPREQMRTALALAPATAELDNLNTAFESHKSSVEKLVAMAKADLELQEKAADDLTRQQTLLLAGAGLAIVLIVAAAGSLMARSISGPIRSLTAAANEAATTSLPELVKTVRELPAGAELPELPPLQVEGSEEIKQLSVSFESLRNTAVHLAAGESQLRQNVSSMFVNLGRRNQNLLNRTLNFIATLEDNERNPETLDNLFRLDHLVTRMRRNAESLLVLAGTESSRTWSQPVDVGDIVRGALSEIEAYDRVDISGLEPVEVRGNAAADVSHMLAELLENATTFSPPSAPVTVIGKYAHDGYLLSITDNGIGMTHKELRDANERLSQAGKFDTSPLMVLGLFVVSRLAVRHGIQVKLAESPAEGVTAKVKLPLELLEGTNPANHDVAPDADFAPGEVMPAEAPSALLGLGGSLQAEFGSPAGHSPAASPTVADAAPMTARRGSAPSEPAPPSAPAAAPQPPAPAAETVRGLTKRNRGAQMPDTGPEAPENIDPPADDRSPDEVRSALAAFQGGVEYGRTLDEEGAEADSPDADSPDAAPTTATEPSTAPAAATGTTEPAAAGGESKATDTAAPLSKREKQPTTATVPSGTAEAAPATTKGGLSRRVKGANMFDTGPAAQDTAVPTRSAEEVRSALSSFQNGQNQAAKQTAPDHGNQ